MRDGSPSPPIETSARSTIFGGSRTNRYEAQERIRTFLQFPMKSENTKLASR
jgi:hypothetical protein